MSVATDSISSSPSYRTTRFRYEYVSRELIDEIVERIETGESVVLLGPREIGKQLVMAEVRRQLTAAEAGCCFVRMRLEKYALATAAALSRAVDRQLRRVLQLEGGRYEDSLEDLSRRLRAHLEGTPVHVVLLISNVDFLPDSVSRRLLKVFRELVGLGDSAQGRFTVLLTGTVDLAPLVYGAESEFAVRDQYVVQGFDRGLFGRQLNRLARTAGLHVDRSGCDLMHEWTAGNPLLLRVLFDALLDHRRAARIPPQTRLSRKEIRKTVDDMRNHPSVFRDVVVHPFTRLEGSTATLNMLQQILSDGFVDLPESTNEEGNTAGDPPTDLELCGIASRQGRRLVWASPLFRAFVRSYFTQWTLGDAFAHCNEWEKAMSCYRNARLKSYPWIGSPANRPRLRAALRAFESQLHTIAGRNEPNRDLVTRLREFFSDGARYLLGFDEVTFWRFNHEKENWDLLPSTSSGPNNNGRDFSGRFQTLLTCPDEMRFGLNPVDVADAAYALVLRLPTTEIMDPKCVVLSCFASESPLTRDRRAHAEAVLEAFTGAYLQACRNQRVVRLAHVQHSLMQAIPEVFRVIGGPPERTYQALKAAGEELCSKGYHRVMFSLVDQGRRRIVGVVDCCPEGEADVATPTNFTLDITKALRSNATVYDDVQQQCVVEGRTLAIRDATNHPLTAKPIVNEAQMRAIVLVPLKQDGEVLGTMHVERDDRELPNTDELRALEFFAQQLTQAIDAAARIDMLEDAVQVQRDSILVIDHKGRIRFVNKAASDETKLALGWQHDDQAPLAAELLPNDVVNVAEQARAAACHLSRYAKWRDEEQSLRVIHASPLTDWRECSIGSLVQIQDMADFYNMLDALKELAACRTIDALAERLLKALREFECRWARFYVLDAASDRLVGHDQYGLPEDSEGAIGFREHTVLLPSRGQPGSSWLCFDRRQPVVLSTDSNRQNGEEYTTTTGLNVLNVEDNMCPECLRKREGDIWIDLPLISRDDGRPLGKVSTDCPDLVTAFQFGRLQILAEVTSAVLAAIVARREDAERDAVRLRQAALRAIGETSHQLQSRLASLVTLRDRFSLAQSGEEVEQLEHTWDKRLGAIQEVLDNAKSHLKPVQCRVVRQPLDHFLQDVLEEQIPAENWTVTSSVSNLLADFDADLLKEALEELIENSRKALKNRHELMLTATLSLFVRQDVQFCRLDLHDNGPGIPPGRRPRIFEDFFSEWPDLETRGNGLGLSRVQSIVMAHRGKISLVETETGACFRIELPRFSRDDVPQTPDSLHGPDERGDS